MRSVDQRPNLRHLCEPLGETKGLIETVGFKTTTPNHLVFKRWHWKINTYEAWTENKDTEMTESHGSEFHTEGQRRWNHGRQRLCRHEEPSESISCI